MTTDREEVAQVAQKGVGTVVSDTLEEGRDVGSRDDEALDDEALGEVQLEGQVEQEQGGLSAKMEEPRRFAGFRDPLSNFFECRIQIYGRAFSSAEQAYQWKKAGQVGNRRAQEAILQEKRAFGAKMQARKLLTEREIRDSGWEECKVTEMRKISRAKARGCAEFVRELRSSKNRSIEEAVKGQDFWGVDEKGNGRNEMGKLLMELRGELEEALREHEDDENEGEYWAHPGDDKTETRYEQVEKRGDVVLESGMSGDYVWKKMKARDQDEYWAHPGESNTTERRHEEERIESRMETDMEEKVIEKKSGTRRREIGAKGKDEGYWAHPSGDKMTQQEEVMDTHRRKECAGEKAKQEFCEKDEFKGVNKEVRMTRGDRRGILLGTSQLKTMVKSPGLSTTAIENNWDIRLWSGAELEDVYQMASKVEWESAGMEVYDWAIIVAGGNDIDNTETMWRADGSPREVREEIGAIVSQKFEVIEELVRAVKEQVKVVVVWIPGPRRDRDMEWWAEWANKMGEVVKRAGAVSMFISGETREQEEEYSRWMNTSDGVHYPAGLVRAMLVKTMELLGLDIRVRGVDEILPLAERFPGKCCRCGGQDGHGKGGCRWRGVCEKCGNKDHASIVCLRGQCMCLKCGKRGHNIQECGVRRCRVNDK